MFFREVIGQRAQVEELRRGLRSGRLPHALLLCGKAGVGKRLVADALAAAKLCDAAGDEACGACPSCRAFQHGVHPDCEVVTREAGRRDIGIGQVRALLETLHRKAERARGRAVILDEAERLTVEAQNALLKTLEEPPPGALLVLVTAVADRLLPTVRSRCALHRFGPLADAEMEEYRTRAGDVPAGFPLALAAGSPGRLRRLADEGLLRARTRLLDFLAAPGQTSPFDLAAELIACAASGAAAQQDEDDDQRERLRDRLLLVLRLLALLLRDLSIVSLRVEGASLVNCDLSERLLEAGGRVAPDRVDASSEACEQALLDLRRNMDPALALEEAAARIGGLLAGG